MNIMLFHQNLIWNPFWQHYEIKIYA